jgi:uncharacterized phiE125 gp8 family phage protein
MLRVVVPPAAYPVTLAEAKAQLRVPDSCQDTVIQALIPAATKFCQSLVQRVFMLQTMEWVLTRWREDMAVPIAPVLKDGIASIEYIDWQSVTPQTLDPARYVVQTHKDTVRLLPKFGEFWPRVFAGSSEPIVVRFDAGYEDPADIPGNVKASILLMLRHLYTMGENSLTLTRDSVIGLGDKSFGVPQNMETLIPNAVRDLLLDEAW